MLGVDKLDQLLQLPPQDNQVVAQGVLLDPGGGHSERLYPLQGAGREARRAADEPPGF